ncbi:four helix bundle protein [Adhaeribacter soli]|uniref:Four helix bundle protein n=1 Tax=Adhaeribacter soli TaxID=2607655 RepID=A0A5N1INY0_9BACT|nr:four helix bundle protein [Adhaeribacter soli]KAA9331714.1 four helix bundle protein [Adhaeribacter soli]
MQEKKFLKLNDIEAYRISFALSNSVWKIISSWNNFEKDTIGKQYMRAIDSISANLAEGFGRYSKKDKINFYRIARASGYECFDWNEKAKVRGILSQEQYQLIFQDLQKLPKAINSLIKYTNDSLSF